MEDYSITTNEFQTAITRELLETYPSEVREWFFDAVLSIPFIQGLISPNRQRAKNRPRDEKGRIIVDLANPHILENMDYFLETREFFRKNKCYTFLRPNSSKLSEFGRWLEREKKRCWEGMVRASDGEWVTGYMYFYMNYVPIMLTLINEKANSANRVEDFPEMWEGIYWRFHYIEQARNGGLYNNFKGGQHCVELARRGASKSYTLASIMAHNLVLGENEISHKRVTTILTAANKEYLNDKDGTLNKFTPIVSFLAEHTQFPRLKLSDSRQNMLWKMGYKDKVSGNERGSLNDVMGVSCSEDLEKLRGKRGTILFEEFGSFPGLLSVYNIVRYGLEEGDYTFGLAYLVGTTGSKESNFYGAQELLRNPEGYNVYSLPNNYDKPNQGRPRHPFFFPSYISRKGCYDKDGNSDVVKALLQIFMARYKAKYETSDPDTIVRVISEMPITPSEAMLRGGVSAFPVADIAERIKQISTQPDFFNTTYVGDLVMEGGEVKYTPSQNNPIRSFPHRGNKGMVGAIEIFEMPKIDKNTNKPYSNRYIAGADPYANDESTTNSLGSIFVLDLWTDSIVAEYTGRPSMADDFHEICRKLCLFYNARLNYENNIKGMFSYFSMMNSGYLLTDTLEFLRDKQMIKQAPVGNTSKGTIASNAINSYARSLIRKWLMSPVTMIKKKEDSEEEEEVTVMRLYTVKNLAFLQEAEMWNPEGNFDRISAFGMLMLLREDRMITFQGNVKHQKQSVGADYFGNDPFFERNYPKNRFSKPKF